MKKKLFFATAVIPAAILATSYKKESTNSSTPTAYTKIKYTGATV